MPVTKLSIPPGVVKSHSPYSAPGRYVDMQWSRFVDGFPQKIGGFQPTLVDGRLDGVCRAIWAWRSQLWKDYCAFGTHKKLYEMHDGALTDITPLRSTVSGTLSDPFDTTAGSKNVVVHHVAHGLHVGDDVTLTASVPTGGLPMQGNFRVTSVLPDSYTVDAPLDALTTELAGGGTVFYHYYRAGLGLDPISTIAGSSVVTIADDASGAETGDTIIVSGATSVGGLTIDGSYTILTVAVDGLTIDAGIGNVATSTATGGGANVSVQYEIHAGLVETVVGLGYGIGPYGLDGTDAVEGVDGYGTARKHATGVLLALRTWHLENYGEWLLANPSGGELYVWKPELGGRAIKLYGSPDTMNSFFVTAERYIVALGTNGDGMQIAWPDQNNPEDWIATEFNTANESRKINGGNFIICGVQVRNQTSLIWTDTSVFLHQWRADDFVFTTTKLADHAGILSPQAFAQLDETVYWVSDGRFLQWNGAMTELPSSDIAEWFFSRLNDIQRGKIYCSTIANFSEFIVLYQSTPDPGDISDFLLYNVADRVWSTSFFDNVCTDRTAALDRGLFRNSIATSYDGVIYDHGVGRDALHPDDPDPYPIRSWVTAAPMDLESGQTNLDIMSFLPDFARIVGDTELTVLSRTRAINSVVESGPYVIPPPGVGLDIRVDGNMAGYKLESFVLGGDYRLGTCRVEVQGAGRRRAA